MVAEVKILIEGDTNAGEVGETDKERVRATTTLVKDGDVIMVVDPGVLESQQVLIEALKKEGLTVEDVNVVCITHSHIDHYRNIGMFPNAKTLEYFGLWDKESVQDWSEDFTSNIKIIRTPGHDYTGISLIVETGPESGYPGIVAICGDVFWKENYPATPSDDVYASDPEKLEKSREIILKMADWIVPGHAGIYKNDRSTLKTEQAEGEKGAAKLEKIKIIASCRKCGRQMKSKDKCLCRNWLCFRCCECATDCDLCSCSQKK